MTVYSNKNENKYKIKQKYEKEGDKEKSSQEIIEPNNIAGIKIVQEENKLTLENSKLSITNIIENYKYITDSCIDLSSFIGFPVFLSITNVLFFMYGFAFGTVIFIIMLSSFSSSFFVSLFLYSFIKLLKSMQTHT